MKARDVILAILIIAFGLSIKYGKNLKEGLTWLFQERESFDFEENFVAESRDEIQIEGKHLNLVFEGWDEERIEGKLIKRVYACSKEEAEKIQKEIKLEKEVMENLLKIRYHYPYEFRIDFFKVKFPASEITLYLKIPRGKTLKILTEHSDMDFSGLKDRVEVENSHGDVKIRDCEGNFSVKNSHADIEVINLNGDIRIFSPHTSVNIENAINAEVEADYEDISIKNLKNLKLITKHSPVEISEVKGEIYIENSHSDISIKDSFLKGKIQGEHLEIDGEAISAEDLQISSSYEPIFLKNFSGNGKIYSKHNEIEIDVMKGSNVEIECQYSDITVNLDREWKGEILMESYQGQLEATHITGKIEEKGRRKIFKADLGGENLLSVKTTYGKITLNRGED